jgi:hypothetical protein
MTEQEPTGKVAGKGKATPSRKQQEAANFKPIVSTAKTPEEKKAAKAKEAENRAKIRAGMASGDERFLPARDKGPQKKLVRDLVDSRLTVGELMIPVMVLVLFLSGIPNAALQSGLVIAMWIVMIGIVLDGFIINRKIKQVVAEKFGEGKIEPGLGWYGVVRATQLRLLRMPKPQTGRGVKK